MKLLVGLEDHNVYNSGNVYSCSVFDYSFWSRYLTVFDSVLVFARMAQGTAPVNARKANGPGVDFFPIVDFYGPWQFLRHYFELKRLAKEAIGLTDAVILRIPGSVGTLLWYELLRQQRTYGVEVVGDPWCSLSPGAVKSVIRPFVRKKACLDLKRQCSLAGASCYVTRYALQQRYPPKNWTTYASDTELTTEGIITEEDLHIRQARLETKLKNKQRIQMCHIGLMERLYKAQDVIIDATGICVKQGLDLELIFIGDGRCRKQLMEQAIKLGLEKRIIFKGQLPPGDAVRKELDEADVFLLPSRQEGLPRALVEAMARGLPCIGSSVGGIPELLKQDYIVEPNNPYDLAKKIVWLITSPSKISEAAKDNLDKAQEYRRGNLRKRTEEFYRKVRDISKEWQLNANKSQHQAL